jgi:hypothetical protein
MSLSAGMDADGRTRTQPEPKRVIEFPRAAESQFDHGDFDELTRRVFVAHTARDKLVKGADPISNRILALILVWLGSLALSPQAFAYRPFDGTDAAVADEGELEIELGPAGFRKDSSGKTLIAPNYVVNLGVMKNWELVIQGQGEHPIGQPDAQSSLVGNGVFLKGVLKEGVLQDKPGASFATEFGVLLPGVNAEDGVGASLLGIVSQRWDWGTAHFNVGAELTRQQTGDVFIGTILEGPHTWKIRPVAEIFYEREFGQAQTVSGLIGAIWQVRDNLAVDVGVRHAVTNGRAVDEIRAGVTFGFSLRPLSMGLR